MDDQKQTQASSKSQRVHKRWFNFSYTTRVTMTFALVAIMTALVAFGVLTLVWEQHFQTYTRENIQNIATTTATQIGMRYAEDGGWYDGALRPAEEAGRFAPSVGIQVVSENDQVLFDATRIDDDSGMSLAPTNASSIATAPILANGETVGRVRVWVYGSNALLTQADQEFRDKSYEAMIIASLIAVLLALIAGYWFARGLVTPINRISRAAKSFGEGNLSARTNMAGEDEISQLGMTFDSMAESVEKDRELEHRLTTDVAHELRTPLMAIQSTVEAMIDGVFDTSEERLDTVNSEVQRLSRLVDAILKLSRLENRSTPLKKQVIDVGDLIAGLIATHEAYVQESGLELHYEADENIYVNADPDLIRQATANLISNAVRYTPEGSITVTVRQDGQWVRIAVADTGIGLSDEEAKMVFSRFWRADGGRNRETGGLGVGLAVVKEIVDQHGGKVDVKGKTGEGATFTISLPIYNEEPAPSRRRGRATSRASVSTIDEAWDEDWESKKQGDR